MRYTKEVKDFIAANVSGRSTRDLVALVNGQFGTDFTESRMKSYKTNHKLKSDTPGGVPPGTPSKQYPQEIREFILKNHSGIGPKDMAALLNKTFSTSYSAAQLKGYYANHDLDSGLKGYFRKGHTPTNKGKKGYHAPGCEKGWFSKGNMPKNTVPVGTEILRDDGYLWVKIAEPNRWKQKHRIIWGAANGPIPPNRCLLFGDQNRENIALDNLILISKAQLATLNRFGLTQHAIDLTKTGILIADIRQRTAALKLQKRNKGR